jgi:hypothetical protein
MFKEAEVGLVFRALLVNHPAGFVYSGDPSSRPLFLAGGYACTSQSCVSAHLKKISEM